MTKNSLNTSTIFKELSIQIAMNGLSFSIRNASNNTIEAIKFFPIESSFSIESIENSIKNIIIKESLHKESFDKITVIHTNNAVAFVPNALFNTANLADYLKFSVDLKPNDQIAYDEVEGLEAQLVYRPFTSINNFFIDTFGSFEAVHHCYPLVNFIVKHNTDSIKKCYIHFREDTFDCFIFEKTKMIFYNNFTFQNEADVLYFLLFTFEQFQLDQTINTITISGSTASEAVIISTLENYFEKIERLKTPVQLDIDSTLQKQLYPIL